MVSRGAVEGAGRGSRITEREELQQQARALGDPTRHRIFCHVADARDPVTVVELTDLVGLNHNAVRQHLAVLKDAGLVLEYVERRSRPGRPRLLYSLNPAAAGSWGTDGPYQLLATLLSEVVRTGASPRAVGRRAGERRARMRRRKSDVLQALEEEMLAGGFRPTAAPEDGGCDFVLERCPFVETASADPGTVCQLHLGLAEGLASGLGGGVEVALTPEDPRIAGCRVTVRKRDAPRGRGERGTRRAQRS